ncbi:MAG: hypothetical protein Q8Q41_03265 [bacterium]|nr:hypothetical protein [bacterium]
MTRAYQFLRYGFASVAVLVFAALQVSGIFSFFGIVPNLALGVLIALLFYFSSFAEILFFSTLAMSVLNWERGLPWELVAFFSALTAAFLVKRLLPWHFLLETAILVFLAFGIFAFFADPAYPLLFPGRFGVEFLYAEASAFLSLALLALWYGPVGNSKKI